MKVIGKKVVTIIHVARVGRLWPGTCDKEKKKKKKDEEEKIDS